MTNTRKAPSYFIKLLEAMDGADLSLNERAVLMAQFKFGTYSNGRDSYVSESRLAEYLRTSLSTIRRCRKSLRAKGWLDERKRGHNGRGGKDSASVYWIIIPPPSPVPARKPRKGNNIEGHNGHTKKRLEQVTGDLKLEVSSTKKPSSPEVTGDHLPGSTIPGDKPPEKIVGNKPGQPSVTSGTADAVRNGVGCVAVDAEPMASVASKGQGTGDLWKAAPKCPGCKFDVFDDDGQLYRKFMWHDECVARDRLDPILYV